MTRQTCVFICTLTKGDITPGVDQSERSVCSSAAPSLAGSAFNLSFFSFLVCFTSFGEDSVSLRLQSAGTLGNYKHNNDNDSHDDNHDEM